MVKKRVLKSVKKSDNLMISGSIYFVSQMFRNIGT